MENQVFETVVAKLKQYDLKSVADDSGVNKSTLYHWVRGEHKARFSNLVKVANSLGFVITIS